MYFYCICGKEGDLRVLLFRHLLLSKSSLFPFGNLDSCSLGAVWETLERPSFYSLQARPGRKRVCSPRETGCLQVSRRDSQVPSVSRLFPFTTPILQLLMPGANKGRWLCRQKQPFPLEAWILVSQGCLANLDVAQVLACAGTPT